MKKKVCSKEFKVEAVRLVTETGMSASAVARDLGVTPSSVCKWVRDFKENQKNAFPGKGKLRPHDEEIRRLEKEVLRLRMERDILKKAITFFAEYEKQDLNS